MAAHREDEIEAAIHETPGVSGGYPCIGATRIPVRTVVQLFATTNDVDIVMDELPQLSREQIEDALAYYHAHPARVDEDIARNIATLAALRTR
ncbi:MAG: DUF433 domain-containing protein [Thermomicrobiales bacterium]